MTDLLRAALQFAAAGWPVFPCRPSGKVPVGSLVPHGCLQATTNADVIAGWWSRVPAANVAIATGAPGIDVVDVDVKNGVDGTIAWRRLRAAGVLPEPFAVVTTPYGGFHAFYGGTEQGNGSIKAHGVDYRGRGGYVVAPPSTVDSRPYVLRWRRPCAGVVVDWAAVRRALDPPRPVPRARPSEHSDHSALVRYVAGQTKGGRNNALFWACARALETGGDGQVLAELVAAATTAGVPRAEAERTARSAYQRTGARR